MDIQAPREHKRPIDTCARPACLSTCYFLANTDRERLSELLLPGLNNKPPMIPNSCNHAAMGACAVRLQVEVLPIWLAVARHAFIPVPCTADGTGGWVVAWRSWLYDRTA